METRFLSRFPIGNKNRKYRQENFIISTFKTDGNDHRRVIFEAKNLNFNMVEFAWVTPEKSIECMAACDDFQINGIFQNWKIFGGFQALKGLGTVDLEELKKYIEFTNKFSHVAGYYVWDEPLEEEKIIAAAKQVKMIEQLAPKALPFTVAIPSYNQTHTWKNKKFEQYLNDYANIIEPAVMSLDYYPFNIGIPESEDIDNSELFLDISLLREISLKKDIPMWFYFQSQDDPPKQVYLNFTPEKLRMQQYNAILYGAKGLQNFNIYEGALNRDGTPGPLYEITKEINYCSAMWGRTLMALTSKHVFHSPEVLRENEDFERFRESTKESRVLENKELPYRCSVGEFEDSEGNLYLFIQNRDYKQERSFDINLRQDFRVYEVSSKDGFQYLTNDSTKTLNLTLKAGDATLLRFDDPTNQPYLIDYVLKK